MGMQLDDAQQRAGCEHSWGMIHCPACVSVTCVGMGMVTA
eukprot:CAMPEP_0202905764 /NCGR_PEP_ID=MMETSP1392-20130828/35938_1 /ASSEMBLY_ACC=CAM_ASM_000868 /TAXON_ID=225041 /ORGANISM="Chlamydomonas chlamydogama, Strain SAG 11-48b" /LENGTH=39 /DNA_ID= /DNA_START= /DNA_END= /DNA_ORIENTATION=